MRQFSMDFGAEKWVFEAGFGGDEMVAKIVIPDGVSRVPDLVPQSPVGSPLCASLWREDSK